MAELTVADSLRIAAYRRTDAYEPSLGPAPVFVRQVYRELVAFHYDERSIRLVEQNLRLHWNCRTGATC